MLNHCLYNILDIQKERQASSLPVRVWVHTIEGECTLHDVKVGTVIKTLAVPLQTVEELPTEETLKNFVFVRRMNLIADCANMSKGPELVTDVMVRVRAGQNDETRELGGLPLIPEEWPTRSIEYYDPVIEVCGKSFKNDGRARCYEERMTWLIKRVARHVIG